MSVGSHRVERLSSHHNFGNISASDNRSGMDALRHSLLGEQEPLLMPNTSGGSVLKLPESNASFEYNGSVERLGTMTLSGDNQ